MKKVELDSGGYKLVADIGKQLMITTEDGTETRAKEITIPSGATANSWVEVDAITVVETVKTEEELKQEKIAALKAELAELESENIIPTDESK